jgi:myosin heavy subunit
MNSSPQRSPEPQPGAASPDQAAAQREPADVREAQFNDRLTAALAHFEELSGGLRAWADELAQRERSQSEREQQHAALQAEAAAARDEIQQSRQQLEGDRKRLEQQRGELAELSKQAGALEEREKQLAARETELAERLAALEQERQSATAEQQQRLAAAEEIEKRRAELEAAQQALAEREAQLAEVELRQQLLEAESARLTTLEQDLTRRSLTLQNLQGVLAEISMKLTEASGANGAGVQREEADAALESLADALVKNAKDLTPEPQSRQRSASVAPPDGAGESNSAAPEAAPEARPKGAAAAKTGAHKSKKGGMLDRRPEHLEAAEAQAAVTASGDAFDRPVSDAILAQLTPAEVERLKVLRRLTSGKVTDEDLVTRIRAEQKGGGSGGQGEPGSGSKKKSKWW